MNQKASINENTKISEKRVYSVDEIQDILGIGRTTAYDLIKRKLFHVVRVGRTIRISKKSFDSWLDNIDTDQH